jgi:hypothetical protein
VGETKRETRSEPANKSSATHGTQPLSPHQIVSEWREAIRLISVAADDLPWLLLWDEDLEANMMSDSLT